MDSPARSPRRTFPFAILLLVATVVAYWPALKGQVLWDDDAHVTRTSLQSVHGLGQIWTHFGATQQYYPVLHTAFWIEHRLWGDQVVGYHLLNVLLHATSALLLIAILRRLSVPGAYFAGLLFALHPLAVESVAWISEQKNTLSTVFYLAALLAYLRWNEGRDARPLASDASDPDPGSASPGTSNLSAYILASVFFVLALLTKSVTATLPIALVIIRWWKKGPLEFKRDLLPLVPWFIVAVPIGLLTAWVERHYIGATGAGFDLNPLQRLLLAGNVIAFYLAKIVWPSHLVFIYPHWTIAVGSWPVYLAPLVVIALIVAAARLARRNRGPLAALLLFIGTLFPVLGFVNVYPFIFSYVANHFAYLAAIPVIVFAAAVLNGAFNRVTRRDLISTGPIASSVTPNRPLAWIAATILCLVVGAATYREARVYRDPITLYRTTLERNPNAWLAHFNLGVLLEKDPATSAEAAAHYAETIRLNPDHWAAHNNLASAWLRQPDGLDRAIAEFETAIRLHPKFAEAHNNLAIALSRANGRMADAVSHFRTALEIQPNYLEAHINLGNVLAGEPGQLAAAIGEYETALKLAPNDAEVHFDLGNALLRSSGRIDDAIKEYQAAIRLNPAYRQAHNNLGAALSHVPARLDDAIAEYRVALKLDPSDPEAHVVLANALLRHGGMAPEAIAEYEAAARLSPDDPAIHCALGIALSSVRERRPDAIAEFEKATQLKPDYAEAHYCAAALLISLKTNRDAAIAHLDAALAAKPNFTEAAALKQKLTR